MILIDFRKTVVRTFGDAVLKGVAAPVMLYGTFKVQKLPNVRQVKVGSKNTRNALISDWNAVSADLNSAVVKYGKTQEK